MGAARGFLGKFIGPAIAVWLGWSGLALAGEQPIAFNHKAHISAGLECPICHRYVREQAFATLPSLEICLMCHTAKMTDNPEEEKIREFAKRGEALRWRRLYVLDPNAATYFSHRRHVAQGNIPCAICHGPMAEQTTPPPSALVQFNMGFCINCHQQRKVSTACADCHR